MKVLLVVFLTLCVYGISAKSHLKPSPNDVNKALNSQNVKPDNAPNGAGQMPNSDNTDQEGTQRIYREDARELRDEQNDIKRVLRHLRQDDGQLNSTGIDWVQRAQDELAQTLKAWPKWTKAKNVIFMIGDGLGITTTTAARIFKAHREGKSTTEGRFHWESMPYTGLSKTYNTDQQTGDSAGSGTALMCGEKTRDNLICVNENVLEYRCDLVEGNEIRSLMHMAMDAGKWGGIATTTRITHATPACAFAVSPMRYWEGDDDVPPEVRDICWDHARQLIDKPEARRLKVVLGGGRRAFIPNTSFDNEYPSYAGHREDGRFLAQDWMNYMAADNLTDAQYKYVENKTDFDNVDVSSVKHLLGLFEPSHMKYEADREDETGDWREPSLAEMTKKSLDILKQSPDGYFLLVEGGRIDLANHDNNAYRSMRDVISFDDAIKVAMDETNETDTLIVVSADHSHPIYMAGYANLDNDILGVVVDKYNETYMGEDDKPYLTLGYGNGPGWQLHRSETFNYANGTVRKDLTGVETTGKNFLQDAGVPRSSTSHGGEDVAIYARGPMAHLFSGVHEQHYIPHAAGYASCIGWNTDFCDSNPPPPGK